MRLGGSLLVALLLSAVPVTARGDQVKRGDTPSWVTPSALLPVPDNASGAVFLRRQDLLVHLHATGQDQYVGYRAKILHPNALQIGNISLAWNPAVGDPTAHAIRIHRDGETIDVLKTASFEILRREDQLEAARLDGLLTAVLRIPDLRVGDELEVEMTTPSGDPSLGKTDAGVLFLAPSPVAGRYRLGLSWDPERQPRLQIGDEMKGAASNGDRRVDFRFDNPPMLTPPKDAPPRYQWMRTVEYSNFADWAAISRHFAPLYEKAAKLSPNSPIKREAARIAAKHADPLDRARAALKLVQQDVRYIYVGLNGGNLQPASADETWLRRYGDCKGKSALLLALLAELGIEANAVLVNAGGGDNGFDERLPSPGLFDHVVVRAQISGQPYWMDGTLPAVAMPTVTPIMPFEWVLPLSSAGRSLEHVEWKPSSVPDEIALYEIDARGGFDKPARITSTTILRGARGLQAHAQFSSLAPAQMLAAFQQELIGNTWQAIDDVRWRYDEKALASVLTVSGTGAVDWEEDAGGARSLALPGGGFSPPEKRVRPAGQDQALPFYSSPDYSCHVTTVRLPGTTRADQWSSKAGFDVLMFGRRYHRSFELRDHAIRMVRGSRVERREIDVETARRDNARIAAFDNSMGWIFYQPSRRKMGVGDGEAVPATYELDWTRDDVPCLTSAARK